MAANDKSREATGFLSDLYKATLLSEEEILAMPVAELDEVLKDEGIDIAAVTAKMHERFAAIKGNERLERAKQARLAGEAKRQYAIPTGLTLPEMRAAIDQRLTQLGSSVSLYHSRFQEAADDDLPELLADLIELEEHQNDTGTD